MPCPVPCHGSAWVEEVSAADVRRQLDVNLIAPAVVALSIGEGANTALRWAIALGAVLIIVISVVISKRRPIAVGEEQINAPSAQ